jgi:hypothetical protein
MDVIKCEPDSGSDSALSDDHLDEADPLAVMLPAVKLEAEVSCGLY